MHNRLSTMTDHDARCVILARILRLVSVGDPLSVAQFVTTEFGSLTDLLTSTRARLLKIPGMTQQAVDLISAIRDILTVVGSECLSARPRIGSISELTEYLNCTMRGQVIEIVRCIFLDAKNGLIKDQEISYGTVSNVAIFPRELVLLAIELGASSVILVHSHPSDDATPSKKDIMITNKINASLAIFGIALHDHVIVSRRHIISLRALSII